MPVGKFTTTLWVAFLMSSLVQAQENQVISISDIEWGLLNPARGNSSPKAVNLWGDRSKNVATGMLVKFDKGFSSPPHIHNISYRGVVIEGLLHNDDPTAEKMWLTPGSFWTQPAGENHITAANGQSNLIYLEIDSGPYLVKPANQAFDNGEKTINVASSNLVWLGANDISWTDRSSVQIANLWRKADGETASFIKLPADFSGYIETDSDLKAVVIKGEAYYHFNHQESSTNLSPASFFSSKTTAKHGLKTKTEVILYLKSKEGYRLK
ncbi:DUF4437 domain-containing protein [Kangiella sp. TOML190]|uniref:DUF4437 domain-containing protein n=1 Tax=Kangiella sp. TOML190 TaxID=2931351 RepID=UPI00203E6E9C|nr:DUF4437 domain-containing protein [Kangiella sp. TOML190]